MDGRMSEDIRIGILVSSRMRALEGAASQAAHDAGKQWPCPGWRRKDGTGTPMAFSSTLLEIAGGIDRLFAEWELSA